MLSGHICFSLSIADFVWPALYSESRIGSINLFEDRCGMELYTLIYDLSVLTFYTK